MAASANPILADKGQRDPTIFCTGYKKPRFYLFTRSEPECVIFLPLSQKLNHVLGTTNPVSATYSTSGPLEKSRMLLLLRYRKSLGLRHLPTLRRYTRLWATYICVSSRNKRPKQWRILLLMREAATLRGSFSIVSFLNL